METRRERESARARERERKREHTETQRDTPATAHWHWQPRTGPSCLSSSRRPPAAPAPSAPALGPAHRPPSWRGRRPLTCPLKSRSSLSCSDSPSTPLPPTARPA
eukprot:1881538-Rhodomonas_salina.1